MSGPERIWAWVDDANSRAGKTYKVGEWDEDERWACDGNAPYVRADLVDDIRHHLNVALKAVAQRDRYAEALREIRLTGDTDDEGFQYRQIARAALAEVKE